MSTTMNHPEQAKQAYHKVNPWKHAQNPLAWNAENSCAYPAWRWRARTIFEAEDDFRSAVEARDEVGRGFVVSREHGRPKIAQLHHRARCCGHQKNSSASLVKHQSHGSTENSSSNKPGLRADMRAACAEAAAHQVSQASLPSSWAEQGNVLYCCM